jgi:hypothetical protein
MGAPLIAVPKLKNVMVPVRGWLELEVTVAVIIKGWFCPTFAFVVDNVIVVACGCGGGGVPAPDPPPHDVVHARTPARLAASTVRRRIRDVPRPKRNIAASPIENPKGHGFCLPGAKAKA